MYQQGRKINKKTPDAVKSIERCEKLFDYKLLTVAVNGINRAGFRVITDNPFGKKGFNIGLYKSLKWSCTVNFIVAVVDNKLFSAVCNNNIKLFFFQTNFKVFNKQVNNAADFALAQRFVEYNLIKSVQKFRSE